MAGSNAANEADARSCLLNFYTLPLTAEVAERAFLLRRASGIKLPDAIIQATAEGSGRVLITRNTRDFPRGHQGCGFPTQSKFELPTTCCPALVERLRRLSADPLRQS